MEKMIAKLIEAIEHDSIVTVKKLCQEGVDLTWPIAIGLEYDLEDHDTISVLSYAIRNYASVELIEVLLEHGCNLHEVDDDGLSTIDIAIKFKREDIIQFCVERGMDVNISHRKSGITPILLAACFNNTSIVELLLKNGADINALDGSGMSAKDYALKLGQKKIVNFLDSKGAKYNRNRKEAEKDLEEEVKEKLKGDMQNRATPTEDMGFDSI
jgi:ankyrin repeat protein